MQFMVTLLENPFRVGLRQERSPDPLILTIFGASGDLTQRKLVPAIYQMKREHRLPSELTVVGFARRDWSHDHFRDQMRQGIEEFADGIGSEELWNEFAKGLFYFSGDMDNPDSYNRLKAFLAELDEQRGTRGNRVFYLAVSPKFFPPGFNRLLPNIMLISNIRENGEPIGALPDGEIVVAEAVQILRVIHRIMLPAASRARRPG